MNFLQSNRWTHATLQSFHRNTPANIQWYSLSTCLFGTTWIMNTEIRGNGVRGNFCKIIRLWLKTILTLVVPNKGVNPRPLIFVVPNRDTKLLPLFCTYCIFILKNRCSSVLPLHFISIILKNSLLRQYVICLLFSFSHIFIISKILEKFD